MSGTPRRRTIGAALADRRLLALSAALWLAMSVLLFASSGRFSLANVESTCGAPAPDVRFAPSVADTREFLAGCGETGLAAYRDLQIADLLYPAAGALVLVVALALLARSAAPRAAWLLLLPIAAALGDYVENAAAWLLIAAGPSQDGRVEQVLQLASALKVVMSWASWLAVVALVVALALRTARTARSLTRAAGDEAARRTATGGLRRRLTAVDG